MSRFASFSEALAEAPKLKAVSFGVLQSWGYTAEEAEQEGLVVLFFLLRRGYPIRNVQSVVGTKLRWAAIDRSRTSHGQARFADLDEQKQEGPEVCFEDFEKMIRGVSRNRQEALRLFFIEGFKYREIAEIQGVPIGTIKSRLNRTIEQLRAQ